jgi:hypothetical protein
LGFVFPGSDIETKTLALCCEFGICVFGGEVAALALMLEGAVYGFEVAV